MFSEFNITNWVASCVLLSLRISPIFAFSPPFTLMRIPKLFKVILGLGLSSVIISGHPQQVLLDLRFSVTIPTAICELALGLTIALAFQLVFAAIQFVGRTIDIQAGYGLAMVVDPTSRAQMPLVGTLLAYIAGAAFFANSGHFEIFHLLSDSMEVIPLGGWSLPHSIGPLTEYMSAVFLVAFGAAGFVILALFLADMVIALMSRTVPQMNVLVLGFQVKSLILLLVLPVSFGAGGAVLVRLMRMALEHLPGLL